MSASYTRDGSWWFRELNEDESARSGTERSWTYVCLHVPTGTRLIRRIATPGRVDFLELLNAWNRRGGGTWLYYEYL